MITDSVAPLRYDVEPWFMSGFDFRCIWEALGLDRLPFPLAYRNRQKYMREVEADRQAALARQRSELTPDRVRVMEALRYPVFLMQGFGRLGSGADERFYRLLGTIGTNGYSAVITQDPGELALFGEDVQIIGCANVDFPQVVLEALPDFAAGKQPRKDGLFADETPADFFRESSITASILLGGSASFSHGYELRNANYLTVVNLADDGAYVVHEGAETFQIVPATVSALMDAFHKVEERQMAAAQRLSTPERE
ncbi:ESX secretion-associated protein EspG [Mycolicibacterium flavescens]|uniref:ESX secretion-associated protein EspG n=1 Tax=Mycolicibacterium flavescens TaxID=1776 RepID=A0A1E3RPL3_MYCFV|nr:ESX secretion-associated protein EspG [Mycolicibacterium flavescens]MCV7283247.1 ESX secretion-associated protein EspG [Mycolicibacterium flavescens]ODQ91833.1 hypothetical protein BHQ18_02945 [Mycolicibacterium flavescens]